MILTKPTVPETSNTPSPCAPSVRLPMATNEVIHPNVMCDGCKQFPLRGVRYYCAQGQHDYCQTCCTANGHTCTIDKGGLTLFGEAPRPAFSACLESPPTTALFSPTQPVDAVGSPASTPVNLHTNASSAQPAQQGFHPFLEGQVGSAAIWEGAPVPQGKGFGAWIGKAMLNSMGIDPYAPMAPQVPAIPFTPAPETGPEHVSVATLQIQLANFPDPVSLVTQHLQNGRTGALWRALISSLSPCDFGNLLGAIPVDYRQSPVAEKLVPYISNFSCLHLVHAVRQAKCAGVRHRMLLTLSAYCVDVRQNKRRVKAELQGMEPTFFKSGIQNGRHCG